MRTAVVFVILGLLGFTPSLPAQSPSEKDKSPATPKKIDKIDGKTLAEWREILRTSPDASRRTTAILAICQFGEDSALAIGDLITAMDKDPDVSPRVKAVYAMRVIEVPDGKDVDRVVRALSRRLNRAEGGESQVVVRHEALVTLMRFIPESGPAVPALKRTAFDPGSWELRQKAVGLLWRIVLENRKTEGLDAEVINTLLDVVRAKNSTYEVKMEALEGLTYVGKPADTKTQARMVSELVGYAKGPSPGFESVSARTMQIWALAALANLGENPGTVKSPQAILAGFLKNKNLDLRRHAAAALGALGKVASPQLPALLAMLDDEEPLAVAGACQAILTIGDTGDRVIDKLVGLLKSPKPQVVTTSLNALMAMKKNTTKVMEALQEQLDRKDLDKGLQAYMEAVKKELAKPAKKP
jgi:HEAT repeat protein